MISEFVEPGHFYSVIPNISENYNESNKIKYNDLDFSDASHIDILNDIKNYISDFDKLFGIKQTNKINFSDIYSDINKRQDELKYSLGNGAFEWMDARLLYYYIVKNKPKKIIEIGSGNSTLLIYNTIKLHNINCNIICIEPFPNKWLYKMRDKNIITLIENKLEEIDLNIFSQLDENDILFIDSSHVVKLNSDVLYYFTKIFPILKKGINIHIHDIFFPYEYPWIKEGRFWNEQYFLYVFLQYNNKFKIRFCNSYAEYKHKNLLKIIQHNCYENLTYNSCDNNKIFSGGSIWLKTQIN